MSRIDPRNEYPTIEEEGEALLVFDATADLDEGYALYAAEVETGLTPNQLGRLRHMWAEELVHGYGVN